MPFLLIILMPFALTVRVTWRFSLGTKNFFVWMLGLNHLLLRLWEWETVNPAVGLRPVTWQTLLMITRDFLGAQ